MRDPPCYVGGCGGTDVLHDGLYPVPSDPCGHGGQGVHSLQGLGGGKGGAQQGWPTTTPPKIMVGFIFTQPKMVSYVYLKTIVPLSLVFGDIVAGRQLDLAVQV